MRVLALILLLTTATFARDDGRYAQSPHKPWFDSLTNKQGANCCSDADGIKLDDPEWRRAGEGKFEIRLDGEWRPVPDEAVLTTSNKVGFAMVWVFAGNIRCFLPGAET